MLLDKKIATRQSYGEALAELGEENKNVVVLDADLSGATKTSIFAKKFPERFFDMGIAEQDMMGTGAGLSTFGKIPYVSTFAVFAAGRAYDQIRNTIAHTNANVKICATHAGITVGEDGATHQMLEDISMMRTLPNMMVMSPSDDVQTKWAIKEIANVNGPVYVRLSRLATPVIYDDEFVKENNIKFEIGKAIQIGDGTDASIIATGVTVSEALKAQEALKEKGINIRVIDVHTIKPLDKETIIKCAKETKRIITIEDHSIIGGLGTAVCEVLSENYPTKVMRIGINDTFGESGTAEELLKKYDEILYIPMSSGLSGSCQTAIMLAQEEEYDGKVYVVNNQRISVTQRQSVIDAKGMAEAGYDAAAIQKRLEETKFDSTIYITLDTLHYLKKGGRITPAAAALGTILRLKPVLQIQGEKLDAYSKARTYKIAKNTMLDAIAKDIEERFDGKSSPEDIYIAIAHTDNLAAAEEFRDEVKAIYPEHDIYIDHLSLSVACHIGPGALAITATKVLKY